MLEEIGDLIVTTLWMAVGIAGIFALYVAIAGACSFVANLITRGGKALMSYGVMGGEYQAMGHMQFLTGFFDYGLDIQEAQDRPRFMADPFTGEVEIEETVPRAIRDELAAMGHNIVKPVKPVGGSQAIWIDPDTGALTGGSDPRKDGCAIGY